RRPSPDTSQSLPPASTGPFQRPLPGSSEVQRTLPAARPIRTSLPPRSTRETLSPAIHGICVLPILSVHSRSPVDSEAAIILPPWLTAKPPPWSTPGGAGPPSTPPAVVSVERVKESLHAALPPSIS